MQFVGDISFDKDEELVVVARPFGGDVIAVEAGTFKQKQIAKTAKQPITAALLSNGLVVARDWKTGAFLQGGL